MAWRHVAGAVAMLAAGAAAAAGCGGGGAAAAQRAPAGACARPLPRDLSAPGPFAARSASARVARRVAGVSRPRAIDPTAWYPAGAPRACRYPLVLFSHGVGSAPAAYSRLCSHLASYGFVVLAPHHPDERAGPVDEAAERVNDMRYLLTHLTAVARRLAPGLPRLIDSRRIGVAGHSFGGNTAAELAASDGNVAAALVMAGGADPATAGAIRAATLAIAGRADTLIPPARVRGFEQALPRTTPHGLMLIAGARHGAYANTCAAERTCAIVQRAATALMETYLARRPGATAPLDPSRAQGSRVTLATVGMPSRR